MSEGKSELKKDIEQISKELEDQKLGASEKAEKNDSNPKEEDKEEGEGRTLFLASLL